MEKKKVFMIMPFQDEFFEVYEMIKRKFSDRFEFSNAGSEENQQNILKDIIQPIYETDIVIADLSGLNPNVMYELGLAHSFNKKTIVITKDELTNLPFDLKQYRAKNYDTYFKKFDELLQYLETNLMGVVDGKIEFSNPVKDFLSTENISDIKWFSEKPTIVLEDETDKGFLDFLEDIESNTNKLAETIETLSKDMDEMTEGITKSSIEIERVNKNGGNGTASFVRKESKKVAKHIDNFGGKLRVHNKNISELWDEIEKNTLGLLENDFATGECNKKSLTDYLISLCGLREEITSTNESVESLKENIGSNIGIERSMTQAIRFVVADLSTYINNTEHIQSSIDMIIAKSRYVVGEIDFNVAEKNKS